MKLYDLAGAEDDLRFSPNCWRIKMALQHKGLAVDTVPWRFVEKDVIAFSRQKAVPVLVDNSTIVADSWEIAKVSRNGIFRSTKPVRGAGSYGIGAVRKILVRANPESNCIENHPSGSLRVSTR